MKKLLCLFALLFTVHLVSAQLNSSLKAYYVIDGISYNFVTWPATYVPAGKTIYIYVTSPTNTNFVWSTQGPVTNITPLNSNASIVMVQGGGDRSEVNVRSADGQHSNSWVFVYR